MEDAGLPRGYYERPAEDNVPDAFKNILSEMRRINGVNNKLVVVPMAQHEAYTNMDYISLSGDYLAHALSENYHGYPANRLLEDLGFVIQHEIGHLNIHPSAAVGWKEEIGSLPLEASRRSHWSNVFSDVIVNYTAANGAQLVVSGSEKENAVKGMNNAMWAAYGGGFRTCYGHEDNDPSKSFIGRTKHRQLLEIGALVDNRYNGGRYDEPATEDGYTPSTATPSYQIWQGHGRGPQYYPSIGWCLGNQMPVGTDLGSGAGLTTTTQPYPENWRQVELRATLNIEYSPNAEKWLGYNPDSGTCPLTGGATNNEGSIPSGRYTVLATRTYDGVMNTDQIRPIEFYQLDVGGTPRWVPAHYCYSLCPHCGEVAASQFEMGFGYKPYMKDADSGTMPDITGAVNLERSRLYAQLLNNLLAGLYATSPEGYGGKTGVAAGEAWLHDSAWDMHLQHTGN
jgi:hypothetical protein